MAHSTPTAGGAGSVTQQAFDALLDVLSQAAGEAGVTTSPSGSGEPPPVVATPVSLLRVGRSRRLGSLLDLELATAVEVSGEDVLGLTERLLLAAETSPRTRIEPLPRDRTGFGFVVVQTVSIAVTEPTGPPVREPVVEVQPSTALHLVPPTHEGS